MHGDIEEVFFPARVEGPGVVYRPGVFAVVKLHYVQAKKQLDHWESLALMAPFLAASPDVDWPNATPMTATFATTCRREPVADARFELPPAITVTKAKTWTKSLVAHAYQARQLVLLESAEAAVLSRPGEAPIDFQARVAHGIRELRDERVAALEKKYGPKLAALEDKIRTAEGKVQKEQSDVAAQKTGTAVTLGSSFFGMLLGHGMATGANVNRVGAVARQVQRTSREKNDVARAEEALRVLYEKRTALQTEANGELQRVQREVDAAARGTAELRITPRKADITVERIALGWVPFRPGANGALEAAW